MAPTSPDRTAYRALVAQIAEKAKAVLPAAINGRLESAVKLVLQGDVTFLEDGTVQVGASDPTQHYRLVGTTCTCTDFVQEKAPKGWCKHRIAAGIQKRVQELIPGSMPAPDKHVEGSTFPEAPVSITLKATLHGHEVLVTLRGVDFASVKAQVEQASEWLKVQAPAQPPTQSTAHPERWERPGWCNKHGVQMTQQHKDGRSWWSHKTAEGWCKGK